MPDLCETGILWRSIYKGQLDGHFIIDRADPSTGAFTGRFYEGNTTVNPVHINGGCAGDILWFVKSTEHPQYAYSGVYVEIQNPITTVKGDRFPITIPLLNSFLVDEKHVGMLREPGDWVAEKGR